MNGVVKEKEREKERERKMDAFKELQQSSPRQLITQGLNFSAVVVSALMIWKTLMIILACESPVVVGL